MIGGGSWKSQNKLLNGVYINFVSKDLNDVKISVTSNDPSEDPDDSSIYLADIHGDYLKTVDGYYLIVHSVR